VGDVPVQNSFTDLSGLPTQTPVSHALSKDLKKRGFKFVGPVIVYAFMEAVGLVNDHEISCPRHADVKAISQVSR
jgi:DNA-3-methyladenine glycosylase I